MKSKSQSTRSLRAAAILTSWLLGLSAPHAMGQSGEVLENCSNRTLSGNFGMLIEGTILGPNLPLRTVSMAHFDGTGNLAEVSHGTEILGVVDGAAITLTAHKVD